MTTFFNDNVLLIRLDSRIDSNSAAEVEHQIMKAVENYVPTNIVFDAGNLEYISSVGLRILIKVKKKVVNTQMINVNNEVYEILSMTGFADILDVRKAFRQVSVEGCRVLGRGAFGTTYKLDNDQIVKVFNEGVPFDEIVREKESAKAAFICGVPTAIPYDTVKVGARYGNVYELINARSLAEKICGDPYNIDSYAQQVADLLKLLAQTHAQPGKMRRFVDISQEFLDQADSYLPGERLFTPEERALITRLLNALPERDTIIHGDFHTHNIFEQDGELILIDMADTSIGHPLFELANMYMAFIVTAEKADERARQLVGLDNKQAVYFYNKVFELYFDGFTQDDIEIIRNLVVIISRLRMISMGVVTKVLDQFPSGVRKKYLYGVRGELRNLYFSSADSIISDVERVTVLF